MLSVVLLSVGAAFAVSDDIAVANDEIITEESALAVEEDGDALEASEDAELLQDPPEVNVVTNDTFFNYFDNDGSLLNNVTADELEFDGDFSGVNVSAITINKAINFTGKNATFNGVSLYINASNVVVDGFTFIQTNNSYLVNVDQVKDVVLSNNILDFKAIASEDGYAVFANLVDNLKLINNTINYVGNTDGTKVNNAVFVGGATNVSFEGNDFKIAMPSTHVDWHEIPPSSGNWVSFPVSEGIVIEASKGADFINNKVEMEYNNVSGSADTIYTVSFKDVDNAKVHGNTIEALGHTYIYGIQISGDNFDIANNNVTIVSDVYYANAIDVEGPAAGLIANNVLAAQGVGAAYGIYSGMNYQDASVYYRDNIIAVNAYLAFGMSLGDVQSGVYDNVIYAKGNYTMGIASKVGFLMAYNNIINLTSSEKGNESMPELFGCESNGVKIIAGSAILSNNTIETAGCGVKITGGEMALGKNIINVVANEDKDAYAIYASDIPELAITLNNVSYTGKTRGNGINNAVYVNNVTEAIIVENIFNLSLVSAYVPWVEIPPSSGKWFAFPISEGIVIEDSDNAIFKENVVNAVCADVVGTDDTIYTVSFKNADNATIKDNGIFALGNTYVYGIILSGDNFNISGNAISTKSESYYANGIDIEGPASGVVENNAINVEGLVSAYAIYSGMNGANVSANYVGNNITGKAYNAFGMSLGDVVSDIHNNSIDLDGNYTTGIAYYGTYLHVVDNYIFLNSSEQGNESIWESFGVESVGVKVKKGTAFITNNIIATAGKGVSLITNETSAHVSDNFINVVGNKDKDAYAIYAVDSPNLFVVSNYIDYQGATVGNGINNALYISNGDNAMISDNNFSLDLVSSYVPWFEIPASSGNWVSFPISEGIVIEDSDNVNFESNKVNVTYSDVVGSYDTIYAVNFKNSDNSTISDNRINASGHTYIYGIQISGDNFTIYENVIVSESDNYYANGIDVEGPASGEISANTIYAKGVESAYAIYSGMNGANVSAEYYDNFIAANAYNAFGMSLGDVESFIQFNKIDLAGNYTTGIAYRGSKLKAYDNTISAKGSNVGNLSVWESFGVENIGIKVVAGESTIVENEIETTGDYAIDVRGTNATVHDNYLVGSKYTGDDSVNNADNSKVYNNTPVINDTDKFYSSISIIQVSGNKTVVGVLTVEGIPYMDSIVYSVGNVTGTVDTDKNGTFKIDNVPNNEVLTISYMGDSYRLPANTTILLKDLAPSRAASVIKAQDFTQYAVDFKAGERGGYFNVQLVDADGNPLANKAVKIGFNGVVYDRTTNETGWTRLQINLANANEVTFAVAFLGDDDYNGSFVVQKITINKKKTSISASAKTFKASAKTKSYTVTLKTDKGSSIDGKTYLSAGKKITLKVNGKTYTAKTKANGQATFKLSITKKGKFTASISFAGDDTYLAASKSVKITIK